MWVHNAGAGQDAIGKRQPEIGNWGRFLREGAPSLGPGKAAFKAALPRMLGAPFGVGAGFTALSLVP